MTTGEQESFSQAPASSCQRTEILVDDDSRPPKRMPPEEGATENDSKRSKEGGRTWLQFHGRRHTRIGDAYQVNTLPQPGAYHIGTDEKES
jgi:hypothetical protein